MNIKSQPWQSLSHNISQTSHAVSTANDTFSTISFAVSQCCVQRFSTPALNLNCSDSYFRENKLHVTGKLLFESHARERQFRRPLVRLLSRELTDCIYSSILQLMLWCGSLLWVFESRDLGLLNMYLHLNERSTHGHCSELNQTWIFTRNMSLDPNLSNMNPFICVLFIFCNP